MKKAYITNDLNFQRSAIDPVGMVAVVSIKTIWNKKRANTPTSYTELLRKYPAEPRIPNVLPKSSIVISLVRPGVPPSAPREPTPPNIKAKPQIQNPSMPNAYTKKFMAIVCATFFALVNPVSTIANPACINITRNPVMSVHMMLIDILAWPATSATSLIVGSPGLTAGTSLMVPVPAPEGSWAREGSAINSNIKMIRGTKAYINKVLFL